MAKHPLTTIINFCSNESRFLTACLEQTSRFSQQVIVAVCDHFFDGTVEDRDLLNQIYAAFPNCLFIEYPFIPNLIPKKVFQSIDPAHFWHSLARLIGLTFVQESSEMVLFLDADEIPDAKRFHEWLNCSDYHQHVTLKFANYWYFREPIFQASRWEDSVVLAQKKVLQPDLLLRKEERDAIYDFLPGPKRRHVVGVDGEPMFHHYSWVRTREEMLRKVQAWGHKKDRDWVPVVEKEFQGTFSGTDFIHGYSYKTVPCPFGISLEPPRFEKKGTPQLRRLKEKEVLELIQFKNRSFWSRLSHVFFPTKSDRPRLWL